LLWRDESWKGWLFSIVVLFLIIRFLFFPFVSFLTGTYLPLAIVESCSMHHNSLESFNSWWEKNSEKYEEFEISKEDFRGFPFYRGFTKGDVLLITGINSDKLKIGDVIVFESGISNPVIHRVVDIYEVNEQRVFSTLGDNNLEQHFFEKEIYSEKIVGVATVEIAPYFGWIKLIFFEFLRPSSQRGMC
jgi:signal peptidase I